MQNNRFQKLELSDIRSVNSFRIWIKNSLGNIYANKEVPNEHLLIYLNYVEEVVNNKENIDKVLWLKQLRKLESDIISLNKVEKQNEL